MRVGARDNFNVFLSQMESIATKTVSETLSKIAAHSQTLQSLVDLGVDISKWERAGLSSR